MIFFLNIVFWRAFGTGVLSVVSYFAGFMTAALDEVTRIRKHLFFLQPGMT
jgi:hypothetical protein